MNPEMILWNVHPLKWRGLPDIPIPFSPTQTIRERREIERGYDSFSRACCKRERSREREDKGVQWPQWWQGFQSPIPVTGIDVHRGRDVLRSVLAPNMMMEDMPS